MNLDRVTKTIVPAEDMSWLANTHGLDTAKVGTLDGAAFAAIYPDGLAKSGTAVARLTATKKYVPYDNADVADYDDDAYGYLHKSVNLRHVYDGTVFDPQASILDHCIIKVAKTPRAANAVGGPHTAFRTATKGQIIHRTA